MLHLLIFYGQKQEYIEIEIGDDLPSDEKRIRFSDNSLKCEPMGKQGSISNSSTSETLIDVPLAEVSPTKEKMSKNEYEPTAREEEEGRSTHSNYFEFTVGFLLFRIPSLLLDATT